MAVPMVSSAEVVVFVGFKHLVASFRVAGVALRDIQTCFCTVSKVVLCGTRNTFATFSEDAWQFFVAGAALWTCQSSFFVLNFASEGFRHKQMLEVFLINSAGRGMKKTWNHGDQALGAAGNTL